MFAIFLIIFLIYIYIKIIPTLQYIYINENTLNTLFKIQNFHDIETNTSIPGFTLIYANSHGENYLFAQKTSMIPFSITDINKIYEQGQKDHIHNLILLQETNTYSNTLLEKIKEYNIQIWDQNKINSLIYSPNTSSILSTSDTSDDKCKIDTNQFNPIQEPHSFLKSIFKKPDRL